MLRVIRNSKISKRYFTTLKETLQKKIPLEIQKISDIKTIYGDKIIDNVTVNKCLNGSRDIKSIFWEPSLLDANKGICFRGNSIEECQQKLPTFNENGQMMPEAMLWLLITGDIPSKEQTESLKQELLLRSYLSDNVTNFLHSLPKDIHPMNALSSALMMC